MIATRCMPYETRIARQGTRRSENNLAVPTIEIEHTTVRADFQAKNCDRCEGRCARSAGFRRRNGIS